MGKDVIVEAGKRITARHVRQLESAKIKSLEVPDEYLFGRILAQPTSSIQRPANCWRRPTLSLTTSHVEPFRKAGIDRVATLWVNDLDRGPYISQTLRIDPVEDASGGAGRDLPHDASGRAANQGRRTEPVPEPVLLGGAL
jgi:DNA-directed RNA polymerase subunit beta